MGDITLIHDCKVKFVAGLFSETHPQFNCVLPYLKAAIALRHEEEPDYNKMLGLIGDMDAVARQREREEHARLLAVKRAAALQKVFARLKPRLVSL